MMDFDPEEMLPDDGFDGTLLCRVWAPARAGEQAGPSPALIKARGVFDLARLRPTMASLLEIESPDRALHSFEGVRLGSVEDIICNSLQEQPDPDYPRLLAPVDIQSVKACGVTFVNSLMERVIEEKAGGDARKAESIRASLNMEIGGQISQVIPGSSAAEHLKDLLKAQGMWSQYLEVGIGPWAEVFTKCQPLSAVGLGAQVGINRISKWNNPEPEIVLVVNSKGQIVGASLGNDVNLRDLEGRSALLLGKAKDNNASCSIGPFIRLLDTTFTMQDLRNQVIELSICGKDGFLLEDKCSMNQISRDITELVVQTINPSHQYPDGFALFTGSLFAPIQDRGEEGMGFTHYTGDVVSIRSPHLGRLMNRVTYSDLAPAWTFGLTQLMDNLSRRGLLPTEQTSLNGS